MVGVAQLVEHPVVVRDVAGSSPVAHPIIIKDTNNAFRGGMHYEQYEVASLFEYRIMKWIELPSLVPLLFVR
jgi:hypothetical protein